MTKVLSIREFTRSGKSLLEYDYIDIEDKKNHSYRGVFVPKKYADQVKQLIDRKIQEEKDRKKAAMMQFAGIADGDTGGKSIQELTKDRFSEPT
jgi:hypothetical protein